MEIAMLPHGPSGPTAAAGLAAETAAWFFQHSIDLFAVTDFDGRILQLNPAWTALLGWDLAELHGRTLPELVHPEDIADVRECGETLRRDGYARHIFRLPCKTGLWRWVQGSTSVTPAGALIGVFRDITEDQAYRAEVQELRNLRALLLEAAVTARLEADANARRLKLALRAAGAGAFEIDYDAQTLWASPEFFTVVGRRLSFADVSGKWWRHLHPNDLQRIRQALSDRRSSHSEPLEVRLRRRDGSWRWIRIYYEAKRKRGGRRLQRMIGMVIDIDERKRQELALAEAERQASAATEAKSSFLANMSHEIRTPMNGVMGVLQLLRKEPLSPGALAMLEEALGCGRMLAEILDDVIDFSRIEAGKLDLMPEPVDPVRVLHGVADLLRPQAEAKGLDLRIVVGTELGWLFTDPSRLRQCLFNLIGNAVKFTNDGFVEVRLGLREGTSDRLRFEIEDSGIGIPEAAQPALFERFHQADVSAARRFGGSGLGLAISRRLAELMDGSVGFISQPGVGSTFFLEIGAPSVGAPDQPEEEAAGLPALRVLVVDDNSTNRMIVARVLESAGLSVETAEDGESAVAAAARGGFDLILMDVQMPGMDGLEATRLIRSLGSPQASAPILALTANVMAHQQAAYQAGGMNGVVAKPISAAVLLAEIARATRAANDDRAVA